MTLCSHGPLLMTSSRLLVLSTLTCSKCRAALPKLGRGSGPWTASWWKDQLNNMPSSSGPTRGSCPSRRVVPASHMQATCKLEGEITFHSLVWTRFKRTANLKGHDTMLKRLPSSAKVHFFKRSKEMIVE